MDSVKKEVNGITITVDKRTMLLGIIMHISNYPNLWKDTQQFEDSENKYLINEIKEQFDKFKDEDVIKMFDELTADGGFSFDAPLALFLQLDDNYKADKLDDYVFKDRLKSNEKVFTFIDKLQDFANKIDFDAFYTEHSNDFQKYVDSMAKAFELYDVGSFFDNYYRMENHKGFNVNLIPFITRNAFSCDTENEIYSCISVSPNATKDNLYNLNGAEKYFLTLPIHEFSHGYINPLTEKYKLVTEETKLFDDIKEDMAKQAYPTDIEIINEHIVRAITARSILYMHQDQEWYEREINNQKQKGFIYIDNILEQLEEYENNCDKYHIFSDYYPEIIKSLELEKSNNKQR